MIRTIGCHTGGMAAASAALSISEIPFVGPIGAVRLGRVDGNFVTNPTPEQLEESDVELIVAEEGNGQGDAPWGWQQLQASGRGGPHQGIVV